MSAKNEHVVTRPDTYDRYYTEKLWSWIPEAYRDMDGGLANPNVLRAFIETFAAEAANQRRSIDRLWEDTIVDHASDWAVPYIGALVGTRMLSNLNTRGRRLDVAKTVAYRRRAGTPYVLEELIHDITGWHGAIVEGFMHLARTRHNYDPDATSPQDSFATPRGGTANLRAPVSGDQVDGPFDDYAHLADLRATPARMGGPMRSPRGLWNIPKLNVHLYRQKAYPLVLVTPYRFDDQRFMIDPSGRDRALFARGVRRFAETPSVRRMEESGVGWTPAEEWQMPAPMSCRLFNKATYQPRTLDVGQSPGALVALVGNTYRSQASLRAHVLRLTGVATDWSLYREILEESITPESAKRNLYGADNSLEVGLGDDPSSWHVVMAAITAADLSGWAGTGDVSDDLPTFPPEVEVLVDPARGRLARVLTGATHLGVPVHHIGAFDAIGAGSYSRALGRASDGDALPFTSEPTEFGAGVIDGAMLQTQLNDVGAAATHAVYEIAGSQTLSLTGSGLTLPNTILQAADRTRPYVRLQPTGDGTEEGAEFVLTAADQEMPPDLTIDGLWLGLRPVTEDRLDQELADPSAQAAPEVMTLALDGAFGTVRLSRMTLDPGGETARWAPNTARPIPAVRLELRGTVNRLVIDRSIVGMISDGEGVSSIGGIEILDSIVVAAGHGDPAIATGLAPLQLVRTTVLGDVRVNQLQASESIVTGTLNVSDSQNSCFRYSAARRGGDNPPQQYKSMLFDRDFSREAFVSLRFGDAGFCQLAPDVDQHLARGAENGGELGAYHSSLASIRLRDLQIKIDEFKPIHLVGQFIMET